jgi:hypothetical protein
VSIRKLIIVSQTGYRRSHLTWDSSYLFSSDLNYDACSITVSCSRPSSRSTHFKNTANMSEQPNISQILAALCESTRSANRAFGAYTAAAQRPSATPPQSQHPQHQLPPQQHAPPHGHPPSGYPLSSYPPSYPPAGPPVAAVPYSLPQPSSSGSIDLSNIKPVNSGSVAVQDAVARARGIAAEKGNGYGGMRAGNSKLIELAKDIEDPRTDISSFQHPPATLMHDWLAVCTNALGHAQDLLYE